MKNRLIWLDLSRSLTLLAMIVFHFVRDLELFGLMPPGTTGTGGWAVFARTIAGSFIFLSGISMVVAHSDGFRLKNWVRRLAIICGAASLVTMVTYLAFPESFIYFGILHCIAACSVVGAVMLRAPVWLLCVIAGLILFLDVSMHTDIFSSPWLAWTGLTATTRPSLDFLPMVPWLSVFLFGVAFAKALPVTKYDIRANWTVATWYVAWPGRHSLAVYLAHQPVLLALIWLATVVQ